MGLLPSWSLGWCSPPRKCAAYQSKLCHGHANHNTRVKGKLDFVTDKAKEKCILIIVQRDATQSSLFIILQVHSKCFGCQPHPSSGVHKTETTASGTGHIFLCSYLPPTWPSLATLEGGRQTVPEAVVTVLFTPDDGCGWHPKHAEWTCRIINRPLWAASRWTVINIDQRCTEP
jgi:hypothetical protein